MKLKSQIQTQWKIALQLRNEARRKEDNESAAIFQGVMMAMDWVQGSRDNKEDYIDLGYKMNLHFE